MDNIVWKYVGKGEFIDGVPARDLTRADVDWLHEDLRSAVEQSRFYRRVERPRVEAEPRQPEDESGTSGRAARAGDSKGKKE